MNLIELIESISSKVRGFLAFVFTRDYSILEKEIFGLSALDLIALFVAAFTLKEIVVFLLTVVTRLLAGIGKMILHHVGVNLMVVFHHYLLRAKATALYLWERPLVRRTKQWCLDQFHHQIAQLKTRRP